MTIFYFTRLRNMIRTMFQIIQLANEKNRFFKKTLKARFGWSGFRQKKKNQMKMEILVVLLRFQRKGKKFSSSASKKFLTFLCCWNEQIQCLRSLSLSLSPFLTLSLLLYLSHCVSSAPCVCSEQQKFSSKRRARNVKRHNCRSVGWLLEVCFAQTELFRQQLKLAKFT